MAGPEAAAAARLRVGDWALVLATSPSGNPRTPAYLRGRVGQVVRSHGVVSNPLDHAVDYPPLYSVVFPLDATTEVLADLHEEWLALVGTPGAPAGRPVGAPPW